MTTGAWLTFLTVTSTVSLALAEPSLTVSWNVRTAPPTGTLGAVNAGSGFDAPDSTTAGPASCVQEYVSVPPPPPEPSSVTMVPSSSVRSGPALATTPVNVKRCTSSKPVALSVYTTRSPSMSARD